MRSEAGIAAPMGGEVGEKRAFGANTHSDLFTGQLEHARGALVGLVLVVVAAW